MKEQINNKTKKGLNLKFEKLTPHLKSDISNYNDALNFAFNEKGLKNIAITGTFGSGKSSVIETYVSKKNKNIIKVSLAHFASLDKSEIFDKFVNETSTKNKEKMKEELNFETINLERKIINQIIYQLDYKELSNSIFLPKTKISFINIKRILSTVLLSGSIILYLITKNFKRLNHFKNLVSKDNNITFSLVNVLSNKIFYFWLYPIMFTLLFIAIYYVFYKLEINKFVKKINLKGNEIELNNEIKTSYFDYYIDEIIHILNKTKSEAILFEDLDRFIDHRVFERLHEINHLVNKTRKKTGQDNLKFIYVIKDDLLDYDERIKFFDFIIPIIPIVDSSNSKDKIFKKLSELNILEKDIDSFLIKGVSQYVNDYRTIKSILNEFQIYYLKQDEFAIDTKTDIDINGLFAIITYKNIFPKDFSELQYNSGLIYNIFQKETKSSFEKGKEYIQFSSVKEIMTIYDVDDYFNHVYNYYKLEKFRNNDNIGLLKFLISNGYISENYRKFISNKGKHLLTSEDEAFIFNVYENSRFDFNYPLTHIDNILLFEFEDPKMISNSSSLNFDLLNYFILKDMDDYINDMFSINDEQDSRYLHFFQEFYNKYPEHRVEITSKLVKLHNDWWYRIYSRNNDKDQNFILSFTKKYLSLDEVVFSSSIEDNRVKSNLIEFVKNDKKFLYYVDPDIDFISGLEKFINNMIELNAKIEKLNYPTSNNDYIHLEAIYERHLYEINVCNVNILMESLVFDSLDKEKINFKHMTYLYSSECEPIYENITKSQEGIKGYLNMFLEYIDSEHPNMVLEDDYEVFIKVIQDTSILFKTREKYIDKSNISLRDFNDFKGNTKMIEYLISKNKVLKNTNNLYEIVISNINENQKDHFISMYNFSKFEFSLVKEKGNIELFLEKLLTNTEIYNDNLYKFLNKLDDYQFVELSDKLDNNRIDFLIDANRVFINRNNYLKVYNNYSDSFINFFINNFKAILELRRKSNLILSEDKSKQILKNTKLIKRIESSEIDILDVTEMIEIFSIDITASSDYDVKINKAILKTDFGLKDLPYYLTNYNYFVTEEKHVIIKVFNKIAKSLEENIFSQFEHDLTKDIMNSQLVEHDIKIYYLLNIMEYMSIDEIEDNLIMA